MIYLSLYRNMVLHCNLTLDMDFFMDHNSGLNHPNGTQFVIDL